MNSSQIRNIFINFFEKNNHFNAHSSSLIPENDPTLMFVNSGMVQFKNIFTGKETRDYKTAVTSQKCVRAGGKHNDLENVGYTARHHTFFEMLGNFSFGDYFKDVAIELSWKLITEEFGIDKDKLLVTVYDKDEESYLLWKKIAGLSDQKIIKISTSDNFWSMGDTGPCGPCSEIFYDHGDKFFGGPPGSKDENGDRFIEIWNLVFMQYEQINKDKRINLPKPSIDTGMGLERVAALLQGTNDNYKTDIFHSLISKSIELSNNDKPEFLSSHKVISDHLRSAAFLISDGLLPSNEGRGYVLRRIMRRGMRHAHTLGNQEPVFHKIFPTLLKEMNESYPELGRSKELIESTLLNEETKFKQTIDNGLKLLEDEINNSNSNIFSGSIAFKLYDTYGFPLDLTQDYLKDKNISVDVDSFNSEMLLQKTRARNNWRGTGDVDENEIWHKVIQELDETKFLGYSDNETECQIIKIIQNDKEVGTIKKGDIAVIILNKTTFYGESGGQIGDTGYLVNKNTNFLVKNTTKIFNNYYLHWGEVSTGNCSTGDFVKTKIDNLKKELIKNNHSSTHLLHASLRKILGNQVTQKGSLVSDEKLRFDFSYNESINNDNILKIENLVNFYISQNLIVKTEILDHQKAIESGAMALFGEKYGEEVRVVSIQNDAGEIFSKELCGGTHVRNIADIERFKIINQSSVASGIRRIEAVTNIGFINYQKTKDQNELENNYITNNEIKKFIKLIKEINPDKTLSFKDNISINEKLKEIKAMYNSIKENIDLNENKQKIKLENIGDVQFIYLFANNYPAKYQKIFIDEQKELYPKKSIILLVSKSVDKISIILGITNDLIEKYDAVKLVRIASILVGGKGGGGRSNLAQAGGNLPDKIPYIYDMLKKEIEILS